MHQQARKEVRIDDLTSQLECHPQISSPSDGLSAWL